MNPRIPRSIGERRRATSRVKPPGSRSGVGAVTALEHGLAAGAIGLTAWLFIVAVGQHQIGVDFHHVFWPVGALVRRGLTPYHWTRAQGFPLVSFPYPAPVALLFVPWSLIPVGVSQIIFVGLLLVAGIGSVVLLGERDWRVYAVMVVWCPFVTGWQTGNLTLLLVCGTAACWRWRDVPWTSGLVLGLMLSLKPIVWPLLIAMLATRRYRSVAWALATAGAIAVVSWGVLGWGELDAWVHLLGRQTDAEFPDGYGLLALGAHIGLGRGLSTVIQGAVTMALGFGCWHAGRLRRDRVAFTLSTLLILVASPVVDGHYFALLIVPLALLRSGLSVVAFVPLLLWLCPPVLASGAQVGLAWATVTGFILWLLLEPPPGLEVGEGRAASNAHATNAHVANAYE